MVKLNRKLRYTEDFYIKTLLNKVLLKEIMTTPVTFVRIDAPFHEVADKITKNGIRHLPVVDEKNKLIGLITERDLFQLQSPRRLEDGTWYYDPEALDSFILNEVMNKKPFSFRPDNTVAEAILKMIEAQYGCIPITEKDGTLLGILTRTDLLELAAQILSE